MSSQYHRRMIQRRRRSSLLSLVKPKMLLVFCVLFGMVVAATGGGESSTCSCPDSKINHVSALSFGMTILSPSFSSLYFNITSQNEIFIKEPSEPIWFNGIEYFWDNAYYNGGVKHSAVCSYHIAYYHKELRKIRYNSTQRPSNITFGCQWYQECCDLGCCTNSILQFVIFLILYTGIGVMVVSFCSQLSTPAVEGRQLRITQTEMAIFCPCHRSDENDQIEDYVLNEMVNREGPPKYDELYPNGCSYTRPLRDPAPPPQYPSQANEGSDATVSA